MDENGREYWLEEQLKRLGSPVDPHDYDDPTGNDDQELLCIPVQLPEEVQIVYGDRETWQRIGKEILKAAAKRWENYPLAQPEVIVDG